MNAAVGTTLPDDNQLYYQTDKRILRLISLFAVWGIITTVLWLTIFVAGLLVDSSYYRAAISYGFATFSDWVLAIITFTFSNVILLAFMSGLLGGITSKMLYTRCFRITKYGYRMANAYQIENPFISAFRGMFVFVAILFMQYVSTFTDLSAINKIPEEEKSRMNLNYEKVYSKFAELEKDTAILRVLRGEFDKMIREESASDPDTTVINKIFRYQAYLLRISRSKDNADLFKREKSIIESKIRELRRTIKVPSNSDFSGIGLSSFSYFKFAVIVSFLAFAFGYDPTLFAEFFKKIFDKLRNDTPQPQNDGADNNNPGQTS